MDTLPSNSTPPNPTAGDQSDILQLARETVERMVNFRRPFDARRSLFFRQYVGSRQGQNYPDNITPRSNTFIPYPFSNVETVVSRTLDAYFSFWPWFETRGRTGDDDASAEPMQLVLDYKLRGAKFTKHFEDLVRNIGIYGHAGIKVDWDWDFDTVTYPAPTYAINHETGQPLVQVVPDPTTGMPTQQPMILGYHPETKQVPRSRPKFTAIDIYDLIVDPDGGLVGHMCDRTWGQIQRDAAGYKARTGQDLYYPDALAQLSETINKVKDPNNVIVRIAELWNEVDGTCTSLTFGSDTDAISYKDMRYTLRGGASYQGFRRSLYTGPSVLLWHGPNQFAHKRNPILHTSYVKLPNEVFGIGAIETISDMTESLNRFLNMITDNWNLGINRRFAYDLNADIDHEALNNMNTPGGKVGVNGNPNNVILPLPTFVPQAGDYQIMDVYKGAIEMASGISDFYAKGMGSPTGNRTASGIGQMIGESNFRFRMFNRNLEFDVLQPLLQMCASMIQQFMTDEEEVMITDAPPGIPKYVRVSPEELIGEMHFDLVAANYATNKMVRQRNLMAFANIAGNSPYWRQREALEELSKVFEIRNYKKLLKSDQEVQMEQQAAERKQLEMMFLEAYLNTKSKMEIASARGGKEGRPASKQFEGKIPGVGSFTDIMHGVAQDLGLNSIGLEGMGHVPEAAHGN